MDRKRLRCDSHPGASSAPPPKRHNDLRHDGHGEDEEESDGSLSRRHEHYTIAWICALHIEMAAACAMLDEVHDALPNCPNDTNTYALGSVAQHNVVIACLPAAQYGTNNAANVMTNLRRTFPSIRLGLMVGIGGGAPSQVDIRLGDVVVGTRVMQYDMGKIEGEGQLRRTAPPKHPDQALGTAVSALRSNHELHPSRIPSILRDKLAAQPAYLRPCTQDRLFRPDCEHIPSASGCDRCDQSNLVHRSRRVSDIPVIHYGAIASGNQVMRDGMVRDATTKELGVMCFEMEVAGLMDTLACLPIRGICDYSDKHKCKDWQRYAAATAAAYARELLEVLPLSQAHPRALLGRNPSSEPSHGRRKRLLESLKFDQIDTRKATIKRAHAKTCRWFLSHPDFQAWRDPARLAGHHGFLWLSGKPGAGKSTIMKHAYGSLRAETRWRDAVIASFFFNARGERLEKSIPGMYRSLLLQLLEAFPDLQSVLDDHDLVPRCQEECPTLDVLKELFRGAVFELGQRSFTCFVDALDECDEQQVMDMVQYFEELAEDSTEKGIQLRVCFSSRHYPYIDIRRCVRLTLEDQPGHKEDLISYVGNRLRMRDPALVTELQEKILEKASGVFLWVVLVVEILNREDRRGRLALRRRLAEIPSGLSELFKDILQRDSEKNAEELQLCVLWVLYAKRPLKPEEYYHALWSGLRLDDLVDPEVPDATASDSSEIIHRYVISSSKGIAEITKSKKQETVQFIHESVRDFLIKDKGLCKLWPDLGPDPEGLGHEKLKKCCYWYMKQQSVAVMVHGLSPDTVEDDRTELRMRYPFLDYAHEQVLYHADMASDAVPQEDFSSGFPVEYWIAVRNLFEKAVVRRHGPGTSLLYLLAEKGHSKLIRIRLAKDPRTHVFGGRYKYPLFAALANGQSDAVAALLGLTSIVCDGVDIAEGLTGMKYSNTYENRTPLTWAAQEGQTSIVKLLLQQGTSVEELDRKGMTALSWASAAGEESVVRLLIENGADVNSAGNLKPPIVIASSSGNEAIVRLLIENGADVNAGNLQSPIFVASSSGHEAIVRLLIKNGADINGAKHLEPPILGASSHGHEAIVRLLIDSGANVNSHRSSFETPLFFAARNGQEAIARLLIDEGADVNGNGRLTPLDAACEGNSRLTPLDAACGGNSRLTPLDAACGGKPSGAMIRLLIEKGAEVNRRSLVNIMPLYTTFLSGQEHGARFLMENVVDVNECDSRGRTLLSIARSRGDDSVARFLIENGAMEAQDND